MILWSVIAPRWLTARLSGNDPGRKVHILRVGTRYIVMDPDFLVDNRHRAVTFDSTLTKAIALVSE